MKSGDKQPVYYNPVPGSRELSTASAKAASELKKLLFPPDGEVVQVEFEGEYLHSGLKRDNLIGLFDKVMPGLTAIEQAVMGHLHRLSGGNGADWARVGKKELRRRTSLSDRRLLKALAGLTRKGLIRPLHRDISGTLYKVYTVDKSPPSPGGKVTKHKVAIKADLAQPREKPLESPISEEAFPGEEKVVTIREIALHFYAAANKKPTETDMDSALAQITYLLEDGFTRDEVLRAALFLAENFGKKADISKLPYYIHQAIDG